MHARSLSVCVCPDLPKQASITDAIIQLETTNDEKPKTAAVWMAGNGQAPEPFYLAQMSWDLSEDIQNHVSYPEMKLVIYLRFNWLNNLYLYKRLMR